MYDKKESFYFKGVRDTLLNLIPQVNRNGTILEIGAAAGNNMIFAKQNGYANKIYGIELMHIPNSNQQNNEFEEFLIGDIENMNIPFEDEMFDVIIMGDVLEHLVDPYLIISKLKKLLKNNGVFVSSIPNVRNLKTFRNIFLRGTFKYDHHGIFDKTHLRFFTKKNIIALFEDEGLIVSKIESELKYRTGSISRNNRLTFGIFEEFLTTQYFSVAKKC